MQYTELGHTGYRVSRLGFGSMRLPMIDIGDSQYVDVERATAAIHRALELGVNYIDTGMMYDNEEGELVVGSALAQWPRRDDVVVAAKCTKFRAKSPGDLRRCLEHQLWRQRRDAFDFYLFHGIGWDNWHEIDAATGWIADMVRAKAEGLVKHIGFSFHDKPEAMIRLIDEGMFDLVTCQYNYLDRANEVAMRYAAEKGLGVVVMGTVGGGRLAVIPKGLREAGDLSAAGAAELAIRFVLSHPGVHVALSGMGSAEMVEQNAAAVDKGPLTPAEVESINAMMDRNRELARLYCTGCRYCMPCPNSVDIPRVFELANYHRVYGMEEYARAEYARVVDGGADSSRCVECGECLPKCPQSIDIPQQLREASELLRAR